jgi:predicted nucleic acid-binding protein
VIVVDASVAAKWFLPEQGSDLADALLEGGDKLMAPGLIRVEVAAAITRRVRIGALDQPEAARACDAWREALDSGVVTIVPDEECLGEAVRIALDIRHPFQDCLYLALAARLDAQLVTADPKLVERGRSAWPSIRLLSQDGPATDLR